MRPMTREEREAFLAEPHVGVLSVTAEPERAPLTTPIWYEYQPGGLVKVITAPGVRKFGNMTDFGSVTFANYVDFSSTTPAGAYNLRVSRLHRRRGLHRNHLSRACQLSARHLRRRTAGRDRAILVATDRRSTVWPAPGLTE